MLSPAGRERHLSSTAVEGLSSPSLSSESWSEPLTGDSTSITVPSSSVGHLPVSHRSSSRANVSGTGQHWNELTRPADFYLCHWCCGWIIAHYLTHKTGRGVFRRLASAVLLIKADLVLLHKSLSCGNQKPIGRENYCKVVSGLLQAGKSLGRKRLGLPVVYGRHNERAAVGPMFIVAVIGERKTVVRVARPPQCACTSATVIGLSR